MCMNEVDADGDAIDEFIDEKNEPGAGDEVNFRCLRNASNGFRDFSFVGGGVATGNSGKCTSCDDIYDTSNCGSGIWWLGSCGKIISSMSVGIFAVP